MIRTAIISTRLRAIVVFIAMYVAFNAFVRIGLTIFNGEWALFSPLVIVPVLGLGALYDLAVAMWWSLPLALLFWLWPAERARSGLKIAAAVIAAAMVMAMVFVAASEFVFWNEFGTRFNFIAVDYLVYTREVLGNIRESYPMPLLLSAVFAAAAVVFGAIAKPFLRASVLDGSTLLRRTGVFAAFVLLASSITYVIHARWKEVLGPAAQVQLAGNGPWEFFHAFRHNEIDFQRFYQTLPEDQANAVMRAQFADTTHYQLTGASDMPIQRKVIPAGPEKKLNVVMVSIESFGAEFIESLGGQKGLAPRFEQLGREGMFFTKLYATGTRTVRGLEALTLSVPPTPGHAIPMRPNNSGLFTVGGVFKQSGYDPIYIYGGYSYFDNMNAFYGGNGYTVIDRSAIAKEDITYENIWGVADEDLFKLAIREIDTRVAAGKKVYAHVMTTTNHRPFTYPEGRIDIPSGKSREGAVKYTDYAIGKFVDDARKKPWFDDTVFIFVADHTSIGRGKSDLESSRYHIPMVIYAPKWIKPEVVSTVASQIDIAPSLLGWMNIPYTSEFFGRDIFRDGKGSPLYLAHYQTVGYIDDSMLVELRPRQQTRIYKQDSSEIVKGELAEQAKLRGIAIYQTAARRFSNDRVRAAAMAPVAPAVLPAAAPSPAKPSR